MRAADVMTHDVVTVHPETSVADAVKLLVERDVSALPVVDDAGGLVGILSEADLMRRVELGTETVRPHWIESLLGAGTRAEEFARSHGKRVGEVMSADPIAVGPDTPLGDIAALFERKRIKRVPVTRDGRLIGIVSRANLIQALASAIDGAGAAPDSDREIREALLARLREQSWTDFGDRNVTVKNGVVHLWGLVGTAAEHNALLALAESVPGAVRVCDETIPAY